MGEQSQALEAQRCIVTQAFCLNCSADIVSACLRRLKVCATHQAGYLSYETWSARSVQSNQRAGCRGPRKEVGRAEAHPSDQGGRRFLPAPTQRASSLVAM